VITVILNRLLGITMSQASHGLCGSADFKLPIHDHFLAGDFDQQRRSDWPRFCVQSGFKVQARKITSLSVQRLRFVPLWSTSRHTHKQHI